MRSLLIRAVVAASSGAVVGTTWMRPMPVDLSGMVNAVATPGVPATVVASCWNAAASLGEPISPTSWSGPLKPGPNPVASRSYASRVVDPAGSLPWSPVPSRSENSGMVSSTITPMATVESVRGRCDTYADQRAQKPVACSSCGPSAASLRRSRRLSTRMPNTPSIAGSSVIAESTVNNTMIADDTLIPVRKFSCRTSRPSMATHTVAPANSTARPEVLRARTADSSTVKPAFKPFRCRVTMNSA